MDNSFKIPNMNEGLDLMGEQPTQDDRMLKILQNINKPINEAVDNSPKTVTCPICGATWTPDVNMEDGTAQVCPMCDHVLNPVSAKPEGAAEEEPTVTESVDTSEEAKLEESLASYMDCINSGDSEGAKAILESAEATAICESTEDGVEVMLEKFVIKVDSTGKKTKVKVRTKKMKRTPAQKAALRKARKTANKGAAKKKRKKAMKARARMGLTESLRKSRTINAVQKLAESAGVSLDTKALERAINEAYDLSEAEVISNDENVLSTLETILNDKGIEVVNSDTEVIDGVIVAHMTVRDTDADVYLGDIADEVAESLQGFDVDYDEPEDDPEDDVVDIDFYFVPVLTNESANCSIRSEMTEAGPGGYNSKKGPGGRPKCPKCKSDMVSWRGPGSKAECEDCGYEWTPRATNESANCGTKKMKKNESEDPEDKMIEKKKCNESVDIFESFAGGSDNVRCKIHPAFIKAGQVIYDADEHTVFSALTESVACDGGFSLAVEVQNSANAELAGLASGAEVSLSSSGKYFLLKDNPLK